MPDAPGGLPSRRRGHCPGGLRNRERRDGGGASGPVQIWEGYTGVQARAFAHHAAQYEKQHPGQKISTLYVNSGNMLQKVLTAVRAGSPPGIAYLYGGQHEDGIRSGRGPGLAEHVAADGRAKGRRRG